MLKKDAFTNRIQQQSNLRNGKAVALAASLKANGKTYDDDKATRDISQFTLSGTASIPE